MFSFSSNSSIAINSAKKFSAALAATLIEYVSISALYDSSSGTTPVTLLNPDVEAEGSMKQKRKASDLQVSRSIRNNDAVYCFEK